MIQLHAVVSGTDEHLSCVFETHEMNVKKRLGPLLVGLFGRFHKQEAADCTLWIANCLATPKGEVVCGDVNLSALTITSDLELAWLDQGLDYHVVCIPPRYQLVRRFAFAEDHKTATSICNMLNWEPDLGKPFGVRRDATPDFAREPLRSIFGAEYPEIHGHDLLVGARSQVSKMIGPWWPIGDKQAGEAGGWWIETATPYRSRGMTLYWRHAQARNAMRTPVCAYDRDTFRAIDPEAISEANDGIMPWEVHNDSTTLMLPWWKGAPSYGTLTRPHQAQKKALLAYPPHDPEHAIRAFLPDRNLAFETGDPFALHQIEMLRAHYDHEWIDVPLAEHRSPKWRDSSLYRRHKKAIDDPGRGTGAGRDLAWMIELNMTYWLLTGRGSLWLRMARDFVENAALPSALLQRRGYKTNFSPDPHKNGVPREHDASQALEINLLLSSLTGMYLRGFLSPHLVTMGMDTLLAVNAPSITPQKWVVFPVAGNPYAHNVKDGWEGFQMHRALYGAYECSMGVRRYLIAMLQMVGADSPYGYIRNVAETSKTQGDRLVHAGPGVAYCQQLAI